MTEIGWGIHALQSPVGESPPTAFVIVDVMSFSTCVALAAERGAAILPYPWRDATAAARAAAQGARCADPRRDAPGVTLSPASLLGVNPGERWLLPSPNGAT